MNTPSGQSRDKSLDHPLANGFHLEVPNKTDPKSDSILAWAVRSVDPLWAAIAVYDLRPNALNQSVIANVLPAVHVNVLTLDRFKIRDNAIGSG